jgi:hypothetical protein
MLKTHDNTENTNAKAHRTEAQKAASRANGAKSQGPVTAEGKAVSSRNALRHGLTAFHLALSNEDSVAFNLVLTDYMAEYNPTTPTQINLVERMALAQWQIYRGWTAEVATLNIQVEANRSILEQRYTHFCHSVPTAHAIESALAKGGSLQHINRCLNRVNREYYQALRTLRELQKESQHAANVATSDFAETNPAPPQPTSHPPSTEMEETNPSGPFPDALEIVETNPTNPAPTGDTSMNVPPASQLAKLFSTILIILLLALAATQSPIVAQTRTSTQNPASSFQTPIQDSERYSAANPRTAPLRRFALVGGNDRRVLARRLFRQFPMLPELVDSLIDLRRADQIGARHPSVAGHQKLLAAGIHQTKSRRLRPNNSKGPGSRNNCSDHPYRKQRTRSELRIEVLYRPTAQRQKFIAVQIHTAEEAKQARNCQVLRR